MTRHSRRISLMVATVAAAAVAAGGLVVPAAQAAVPNPVLHYTFDSAAGTSITDASGNGHTATLAGTGATFSGGSLVLPGGAVDSGAAYVQLPTAPFVGQENLTISLWLQNTETAGNFAAGYVGGTSVNNGYWLFNPANPSGYVKSVVTTARAGAPSTAPYNTEVGPGRTGGATTGSASVSTLAQYTTVINGSAGTMSVYVNGDKILDSTISADISDYGAAGALVAYLGKSPYADKFASGRFDDFAVYQSALTAAEVKSSYNNHAVDVLQAAGITIGNAMSVLPSLGGAITGWTSSDSRVVIGSDGFSASVQLPANGSPSATVTLSAIVEGTPRPVTATILPRPLASSALAVPTTITSDLPATVNGETITWDDGLSGAVVAANGHVTRPATSRTIHLRATVPSLSSALEADVTVLDNGGDIATYVKTVTTTSGVRSDVLAYADDRRTDALYLAAKPSGSSTWHSLNRSQAVLYVIWDGTQAENPNSQMGSPSLFHDKDGALALVASQNNATGKVYVWDSNGRTFSNQRLVTVATDGSIVTNPSIVWDAVSSTYSISWTDALGGGRVTRIPALTTTAVPSAAVSLESVAKGATGTGLPAFADLSQTTVTSLSTTEFDALYKKYVDLDNTGVDVATTTINENATLTAATLPEQATLEYNDGSTKTLDVEWDADDIAAVDTTEPGTYEVTGTVQQDDYGYPFIKERADPHVFYNEADGYFYSSGSYYPAPPASGTVTDASGNVYGPVWSGATSYRAIGLRRSATLEGLSTAPESLIVDPDNTPGYGWRGFIWAPEFHKINGTWYILVGMSQGSTGEGFPSATTLIPFTGTDADIAAGKMLDKTYWGAPVILGGAPSFDVSYFERVENGAVQGYYVLPNTPAGAQISVVKATMGPKGTVPQFSGSTSRIYSINQPWQYGKQEGSYSATGEGIDQGIVEGPYIVSHAGQLYLSFSGGTVDKYYDLGVLRAAPDADLTAAASWSLVDYPLLTTYDTQDGQVGGASHAGGGHNSFVVDESGNLALIYHARPYPDPHGSASGAGGLFDPDRNTMVKSVNVRADGTLDLSVTADEEVSPTNKTVTAQVVVRASDPGSGPVTGPGTGGGGGGGPTTPVVVTTATSVAAVAASVALGANGKASVTVIATVAQADATGAAVRFTLGSQVVTAPVAAGRATATLTVSAVGTALIGADYLATATSAASRGETIVTVTKAPSKTTVSTPKYAKALAVAKKKRAKTVKVPVTVKVTVAGTARIASGKVTVSIGKVKKTLTVKKGVASTTLTVKIAKKVSVKVSYAGTTAVSSSKRVTTAR